jgi:hypothetical protein
MKELKKKETRKVADSKYLNERPKIIRREPARYRTDVKKKRA